MRRVSLRSGEFVDNSSASAPAGSACRRARGMPGTHAGRESGQLDQGAADGGGEEGDERGDVARDIRDVGGDDVDAPAACSSPSRVTAVSSRSGVTPFVVSRMESRVWSSTPPSLIQRDGQQADEHGEYTGRDESCDVTEGHCPPSIPRAAYAEGRTIRR